MHLDDLHRMFVHFPIALLYTSVALDWLGYWLRRPMVTRFAYYLLALGFLGAVASVLVGPDPEPEMPVAIYNWHTLFALTTILLSLVLLGFRFFAVEGMRGRAAAYYLAGSLLLLAAVSGAGYFGGFLASSPKHAPQGLYAPPGLPVKLLTVLLVVLAVVLLTLWLMRGDRIAPEMYPAWRAAVHQQVLQPPALRELGNLWTLQRAEHVSRPALEPSAHDDYDVRASRRTDAGETEQDLEQDLGTATAGGRAR
jgi:uncharacterized membrane protein